METRANTNKIFLIACLFLKAYGRVGGKVTSREEAEKEVKKALRGRPPGTATKKSTTVRFDNDVLDALYPEIDFREPLIGIKGARGSGKTTLMLQHALAGTLPIDKIWCLPFLSGINRDLQINLSFQ